MRLPLPGPVRRPVSWNWRIYAAAAAFLLIQVLLPSGFPQRLLVETLLECLALFLILSARSGQIERQSVPKFAACWFATGMFWLLAERVVLAPMAGSAGRGAVEFAIVLLQACAALLFGYLAR